MPNNSVSEVAIIASVMPPMSAPFDARPILDRACATGDTPSSSSSDPTAFLEQLSPRNKVRMPL